MLWDRLDSGNVLLASPRRFGKTSLMYRLLDKPQPGWIPFHIDAESIREPTNFIITLIASLTSDNKIRNFLIDKWGKTSKWIRNLFEGVEISTPMDVEIKLKIKPSEANTLAMWRFIWAILLR